MRLRTRRRDGDDRTGKQIMLIRFDTEEEVLDLLAVLDKARFGDDRIRPLRGYDGAAEFRRQFYRELGWRPLAPEATERREKQR